MLINVNQDPKGRLQVCRKKNHKVDKLSILVSCFLVNFGLFMFTLALDNKKYISVMYNVENML